MDQGEGLTGALADTEKSQELLEEMLWRFRVEDASPWNYSMFALVGVVVLLSAFLLRRNIQARRKQKMQPPKISKQDEEVQHVTEAITKDDNCLSAVTETLLSEKPSLTQEETEFKGTVVPEVFLQDPQESES
ncbi:organic solute transporter subunit beta [Suncus etruscus]|uniref:organic solute transporter subunit beta n=1 Tax=Suncus etruscus TaxID=109475 RepID=UPI00210FA3D7|nr:organic solute transporter subunit beta [Suncus etruscus]